MNVREKLDKIKIKYSLSSDEELSLKLGTTKANIDKWIQRKSIPSKWEIEIGQKFPNILNNSGIFINGDKNIVTHNAEFDKNMKAFLTLFSEYGSQALLKKYIKELENIKKIMEV